MNEISFSCNNFCSWLLIASVKPANEWIYIFLPRNIQFLLNLNTILAGKLILKQALPASSLATYLDGFWEDFVCEFEPPPQVFHKIITSGHHRLQPLFDCILTIIVNGRFYYIICSEATIFCHLKRSVLYYKNQRAYLAMILKNVLSCFKPSYSSVQISPRFL